MKLLKKLLIVILAIVLLLIVIGFILPKETTLERTRVIDAPVEMIYAQIEDLPAWEKWSPWHQMDTAMTIEYHNNGVGKGAAYSWKSDSKNVGNGTMTITDAKHFEFIATKMEFEGQNGGTAKYTFEEVEGGVKVSWDFYTNGGMNPFTRLMNAMFKGMIAKSYDQGLEAIDMLCQDLKKEAWFYVKIKTKDGFPYYSLRKVVPVAGTGDVMGQMYGKLMTAMQKNEIEMNGVPFALYHTWGETTDMECGIPVADNSKALKGIIAAEVVENTYAIIKFKGPYENLMAPHNYMGKWLDERGMEISGAVMEKYKTGPQTEPDPNNWITYIMYPVK